MARDKFPVRVVRLLADRAGHRCSRPGCLRPTIGASTSESTRVVIVGEAAHVTAASVGGPRFEGSLTPDQRRSPENGIWLCVLCATIIDKDPGAYPDPLLRQWKEQRERASAAEVSGRSPVAAGLRFEPFIIDEGRRYCCQDGSRLMQPGPVVLNGRAMIGVIANEGPIPLHCRVKVVAPSRRSLPLELSEAVLNPGDTDEFRLCITAAVESLDRIVLLLGGRLTAGDPLGDYFDAGEVIYPMPDVVEVEIRVTTTEGASLRQALQLTRSAP